MTRGADNVAALKLQWAVSLCSVLREVIDDLPEGHAERPGLIRACELTRVYGTDSRSMLTDGPSAAGP